MLKSQQRQWLNALTFRDEPFPGILFVTALGILPVTVGPQLYYTFYAALSMNTAAKATAFVGVVWGVFLYALGVRGNAIEAFVKPLNLGKWGKIACGLLLFLSDGLLLTFLSHRKRRYAALLLSICVLVVSIGALFLYLESFAWALPYFTLIGYALFACKCGILLALYGDYSRKGLAKLIPFAVALVICVALYAWDARIRKEQDQIKSRVVGLVDCPTSIESIKELMERGVSPEETPLKNLAEYEDRIDEEEYPSFVAGRQEVQQAYAAFLAKHADYIRAVREIASAPPERIAHSWQGNAFETELPELKPSRAAARFLALEMRANPDNRAIIASRNREMMALRDWMARTPFLISTYVAASIDGIRLHALAFTLAYNDYSLDEWEALLGPSPDWKKYYARSIATEAVAYDDLKKSFLKETLKQAPIGNIIGIPLLNYGGISYFALATQQDNAALMNWRFAERLIDFTLAKQHSFAELLEWDVHNTQILKRSGSFNTLFWPSMLGAAIKQNASLDDRQLAILAWQVMDFRRSHNGSLPESLDALDGVIITSSDGRPFEYEHGTLADNKNEPKRTFQGFRISRPAIEFQNGRIYRAFISVPLD